MKPFYHLKINIASFSQKHPACYLYLKKNYFALVSAHQQFIIIETLTSCFHPQVASCKQRKVL